MGIRRIGRGGDAVPGLALGRVGLPTPARSRARRKAGQLKGTAGADRLYGYGGDDTMDGGRGADVVIGGGGDDFIEAVDNFADKLYGGDGNDRSTSAAATRAYGGAGNDFFNALHEELHRLRPGQGLGPLLHEGPRTKNCERVTYAPIG